MSYDLKGDIFVKGNVYDLMVNGEYVDTIRADTIEQADTIAHQLHPYLTDDDYELIEGGFEKTLDWVYYEPTHEYILKCVYDEMVRDNQIIVGKRTHDINKICVNTMSEIRKGEK